jgi:hypothetical protein
MNNFSESEKNWDAEPKVKLGSAIAKSIKKI